MQPDALEATTLIRIGDVISSALGSSAWFVELGEGQLVRLLFDTRTRCRDHCVAIIWR
jgi:hypothetical protein